MFYFFDFKVEFSKNQIKNKRKTCNTLRYIFRLSV